MKSRKINILLNIKSHKNKIKNSSKKHVLRMYGENEVLTGEKWACYIWFRDKIYFNN